MVRATWACVIVLSPWSFDLLYVRQTTKVGRAHESSLDNGKSDKLSLWQWHAGQRDTMVRLLLK